MNSLCADIVTKITDFAKSETLSPLENRNLLLEGTVVSIVTRYLNPMQYDERMEFFFKTPDYEYQTLLTLEETDLFCAQNQTLIEKWIEDIKDSSRETPNLYRISNNYLLDELIQLY